MKEKVFCVVSTILIALGLGVVAMDMFVDILAFGDVLPIILLAIPFCSFIGFAIYTILDGCIEGTVEELSKEES